MTAFILRGPSSVCSALFEAVQRVCCRKQRGKGDPTVLGALLAQTTAPGAVAAAVTAAAIALLARAFSITC